MPARGSGSPGSMHPLPAPSASPMSPQRATGPPALPPAPLSRHHSTPLSLPQTIMSPTQSHALWAATVKVATRLTPGGGIFWCRIPCWQNALRVPTHRIPAHQLPLSAVSASRLHHDKHGPLPDKRMRMCMCKVCSPWAEAEIEAVAAQSRCYGCDTQMGMLQEQNKTNWPF